MATTQATYLNTVTVSGEVVALKYYADQRQCKIVLTLSNAEGSYCIEFVFPGGRHFAIEKGDQVIVHGNLFSTRRQGKNTTKILAKALTRVDT